MSVQNEDFFDKYSIYCLNETIGSVNGLLS